MFFQIYEAALKADIKGLKNLGVNKSNIDAFEDKYPFLSAAGKLALDGHISAVKLLTGMGANANYIVQGFALAGNHEKVEEYRTKHSAGIDYIAQAYVEAGNYIPPFYNAVKILEKHGSLGNRIISIMARLKDGQENNWNPYWAKSGVKLDRLIHVIEGLKETDNLEEILNDANSSMYKALNLRRINPCFGIFGKSDAKSLTAVKNEIQKNSSSEDTILMSTMS